MVTERVASVTAFGVEVRAPSRPCSARSHHSSSEPHSPEIVPTMFIVYFCAELYVPCIQSSAV
jgi:hypothetical protein